MTGKQTTLSCCLYSATKFLLQGSGDVYSDYEDISNSQIRRITAKRLLESKQTIPHYYLTIDCRVDKLVKLRSQLNESLAKEGKKLSVNDFVIKASVQVSCSCCCKQTAQVAQPAE